MVCSPEELAEHAKSGLVQAACGGHARFSLVFLRVLLLDADLTNDAHQKLVNLVIQQCGHLDELAATFGGQGSPI